MDKKIFIILILSISKLVALAPSAKSEKLIATKVLRGTLITDSEVSKQKITAICDVDFSKAKVIPQELEAPLESKNLAICGLDCILENKKEWSQQEVQSIISLLIEVSRNCSRKEISICNSILVVISAKTGRIIALKEYSEKDRNILRVGAVEQFLTRVLLK